jgi:hypothetical protein
VIPNPTGRTENVGVFRRPVISLLAPDVPGLQPPSWSRPTSTSHRANLLEGAVRSWVVCTVASAAQRDLWLRRTRLRRLGGARTWSRLGIFAYNLQPMTAIAR